MLLTALACWPLGDEPAIGAGSDDETSFFDGDDEDDEGSRDSRFGWDTREPRDTGGSEPNPEMLTPGMTWDEIGLTVEVFEFAGFGISLAQTGLEGGWYGESCLGDDPGGYDICHGFDQPTGQLRSVADRDAVVEGETTLFSVDDVGTISFLVWDIDASAIDDTNCWFGGEDTTYYARLGYDCAE